MLDSSKKNNCETIIAEQARLEGKIIAQGDIYIGGVISGQIKAKNIQVGQFAKVKADIEVENIVIAGEVKGAIKTEEKLEITETGRMIGDVDIKILSTAFGAVFHGQCNMARKAKESINTMEKISLKETIQIK